MNNFALLVSPHFSQSQRDCDLQPRVATKELPWVWVANVFNPNGVCVAFFHSRHNPVGVVFIVAFSQGSSFLATLGFEPESLWDSIRTFLNC